jgi:transcriptional regulator with XRE-family HTH domain
MVSTPEQHAWDRVIHLLYSGTMGTVYELAICPDSSREGAERVSELRRRIREWGLSPAEVARAVGVSRQYVWQVLRRGSGVTEERLNLLELAVASLIEQRRNPRSIGQRLRTARLLAGLTLRETAEMIGYSWVAVERWEKDICLPKPGVLWHLRQIYRVGENWLPRGAAPGAAPLYGPSARRALPGAE